MLVTFAEAYLEDVLDSFLTSSLASSTLPSDLREEFNKKWRKEVMRSGNPSHWIKHLRRFGVRGYSDDLPDQLKQIWDQRHRIVHLARPGSRWREGCSGISTSYKIGDRLCHSNR